MKTSSLLVAAAAAAATLVPWTASARAPRPSTGKGKSVGRVVADHIAAVEACDSERLVAGYAPNAKLFFPDGVVVKGSAALKDVYDDFVKPRDQGGLCGLRATPVDRYRLGGTVFVKFRVTAPFLAKTYFSTDGYVIRNGLIYSEMSTFDSSKLTFKQAR